MRSRLKISTLEHATAVLTLAFSADPAIALGISQIRIDYIDLLSAIR